MKKSLPILALAMLVTGPLLVVLPTGCASTRTQESTGEYVDDSTITTKVKAALVGDDMVKASDISVETFKGVVQLSGFVDNSDQKDRAAKLAHTVLGVRDVQNKITVKK